jgi:murein DD-endopeptidase MepM/ murein hydrolase activator NlpD
LPKIAGRALQQRLRTWFPDREFFMRSQGQVRFIKISTRLQVIAAAITAALLLVWLISVTVMAASSYISTRDRLSLLEREAKVTSAENRVDTYKGNLKGVADDLQRRQQFIEKMVGTLPEDVKQGETVSNSSTEAAKTVGKVSLSIPEAAPLARIEARQLAFVEGLTRLADRRAAAAEAAIRKLGLNPDAMLAMADGRNAMANGAVGGPFIGLSTSADGSIDPRFQRLGASLERMEVLTRSLAGIPNVLPANLEYISSGFGYRADPFTGAGAFHPGLDFKGPIGAPIYAAAKGTVSFVGQRSGYGNCVEIDHGNGLVTRYAHMSGFRTTLGKAVAPGEQIGVIGSTGRSTGPHLHFEVRINDSPVNPRPFLESAPHVLEEARSASAGLRK